MSEGFADSVKRKHRKTCKVVLERLDEEALENCLQKYGLKLSSKNGSTKLPIHCKNPSKTDKSAKRKWAKRKNFELFIQKSKKFKRKKIKPLCYTDDENSSEDNTSSITKREAKADASVGPEVFSNLKDNNISFFKSDITTNVTPESEKASTADRVNLTNKNETERKSPLSEVQGKGESILKHHPKNSFHGEGNNSQDPGEVEIIQVLPKRSSVCDKANPDKKSTEMSPVQPLAARSDGPVQHKDLGDDDYDSRDDSEDDRNTVIFEEEFQKDSDLDEFLELEEKEVINKKFNNREITNRKRQRLVKFKRKSMAGRTSATFVRPKIKVTEGACREQEACEKPIECVSEECLGEVCSLVERLHELYRIILQLKKELPKNAELAVHFTRVINAQQENFHKEIRKSQKAIIKCYEKMLSVYSDTGQVAQVIGKRTSLSVEDIVNVISRCILIEGQCEADETAVGNQEKALERKNKKSSENLTRLAKTKISQSESLPKQQMNESCLGFPSYTPANLSHVNHRPKVVRHPTGESHTPLESPAREKIPAASDFLVKDSLQGYDSQITRKTKPQAREQQNPLPRHHYKEPAFEQSLQTGLSLHTAGTAVRHSVMHKPTGSVPGSLNSRYSACISAQNVSPPHASRDGLSHATALFQRGRPPPEFSAPGNESISNTIFPLSIRLPAVQNNTEYNRCPNKPLQNTQNFDRTTKATESLRSGASISVKYLNGSVGNSLKEIIQPSGAQCPLDSILSDSVRLSDRRRLFGKIAELSGRNCNVNSESVNSATQDVEEVLDPTIPQKLTMRNCRLQAGPVLGLQDKGGQKSNPLHLLTGKQKISTEPLSLDRKDSNSRVYVCAQNDCKSPGVRVCKGCQSVIYCSETCQLKHWTLKHKSECYQLKALRG